ncbi:MULTISPECIES: class III lanthionine synthetase LanKC [unclassified Micromonospora]|uniref:class III lanthionine synthetase LanKC n=1 Tax=unclassified Micromonospora TaxID=2617518 RepID=UPI0022BA7D90|nr:class III lanthionine synthetase LanKC [Micromonospora sp. AKA38]GHJ15455.1 serine/threonine protein kinase [Micromonospora sp. AKA38]
MDNRYQYYRIADPTFYDRPGADGGPRRDRFGTDLRAGPGWDLSTRDGWTMVTPPRGLVATQGWKIHVSATLDNARRILDTVSTYCQQAQLAYKFLSTELDLTLRNSKYADRAASGKFITIYPEDTDELEAALRRLGARLDGEPGPYILSDLRWDRGPLFVRFGGFAPRRVTTADGSRVLAVRQPDGTLVPDRREPSFSVPAWVDVPAFLRPAVQERGRQQTRPEEFPYEIEGVLHFSNGGGVYRARDVRTDRVVVLREGRPHAGIDGLGRDAVHRLDCEADMLARLRGLPCVPALYEKFTCWEHVFLAEEFIEGRTLGREFSARYPLTRAGAGPDEIRDYVRWALDVLGKVGDVLADLHGRGVVFGDLHPHNVMVQPDGAVRLIDFELATGVDDSARPAMGAPGYVAADGRTGVAADRYALGCLQLSMFLPLTAVLPLAPGKAAQLVTAAMRRFDLPAGFGPEVVANLGLAGDDQGAVSAASPDLVPGDLDTPEVPFTRVRAALATGILATATPGRRDRLFPGDIEQFQVGGLGLAYGAAGVLHVLDRTGAGRFPEHEEWLVRRVQDERGALAPGFYDGLHGVCHVLDGLGRHEEALTLLDRAPRAAGLDLLSSHLFDGLAGIGLNYLHFATATGDRSWTTAALDIASRLEDRDAGRAAAGNRPAAGLLRGASGVALLSVRLFEATGDRAHLESAERWLRHDLGRCVLMPDGSRQVDDGWRVLPYLAAGSAGIAMVLREFLRHRPSDELGTVLGELTRAACAEFTVQSGLFNGRAGLLALLLGLDRSDVPVVAADGGGMTVADLVRRHVAALSWHAVAYRGGLAFPGDQLERLSTDLATGAAGVLLVLWAAARRAPVPVLPFLGGTVPRRERRGVMR